jgi:ABC-type nitrate/sulfonate/bicarbonate transport system substrate-binding protein
VVVRESSSETTTKAFQSALERAYRDLDADPDPALADLLEQVPDLEEDEQAAQLRALTAADAFGTGQVEPERVMDWLAFAGRYGIVDPKAVHAQLEAALAD